MPPTGMRTAQINKSRANVSVMLQETGTLRGMMGTPRTQTEVPNVRCRVQAIDPSTGKAVPVGEINEYSGLYKLQVLWDQSLEVDWQFDHNGHTYDIKALVDDETPLLFRQAYMLRVTK